MGTKMAPSYANLFLGKFEHDALLNSPYQPHIWLRFNAWFNFTCYHPPPRATPGTSPALRSRGWGIVWNGLVPGGGGWGKSKTTSCCSWEVRHFSVDAEPHKEDCLFPGESLEFVADWLEKNNLPKLKSVFEGTFLIIVKRMCIWCVLEWMAFVTNKEIFLKRIYVYSKST